MWAAHLPVAAVLIIKFAAHRPSKGIHKQVCTFVGWDKDGCGERGWGGEGFIC